MSTWHQRQHMPILWHATQWTVVIDPPEETLTISRFYTDKEANDRLKVLDDSKHNIGRFAYILPPSE